MAKQKYANIDFKADTLAMIRRANAIIGEYQAQGYKLTLRQLYYQHVARGLITNTLQSYKRLGSIINDGRLAGLIDWDAIEDRTRNLEARSTWESPEQIISAVAQSYAESPWADQPYYVEVWVEKEALVGVIERTCRRLFVPWFACRGYVSQSELKDAGDRLAYMSTKGKTPLVLHLGDHDPSGIDMTRDNRDRLSMFAGEPVEVKRLALNMDQVDRYGPPPNPAKSTDARFAGYLAEHGDESWELDALEPSVIDQLISDAVRGVMDHASWQDAIMRSDEHKDQLGSLAGMEWSDVVESLGL